MDLKSTKVCTGCGMEKSRGEFYPKKDKTHPNKVSSKCRKCLTKRSQAWHKAHPKPKKLRKPATFILERRMLNSARARAREFNLPFDLEPQDILIPSVCPVLGIPLVSGAGRGKFGKGSPSLDRIKPELGYVRGNVAVISYRANAIKQDANSAEIFLVARWVAAMGA